MTQNTKIKTFCFVLPQCTSSNFNFYNQVRFVTYIYLSLFLYTHLVFSYLTSVPGACLLTKYLLNVLMSTFKTGS
jgi:hypothetical protein